MTAGRAAAVRGLRAGRGWRRRRGRARHWGSVGRSSGAWRPSDPPGFFLSSRPLWCIMGPGDPGMEPRRRCSGPRLTDGGASAPTSFLPDQPKSRGGARGSEDLGLLGVPGAEGKGGAGSVGQAGWAGGGAAARLCSGKPLDGERCGPRQGERVEEPSRTASPGLEIC